MLITLIDESLSYINTLTNRLYNYLQNIIPGVLISPCWLFLCVYNVPDEMLLLVNMLQWQSVCRYDGEINDSK